MYLTGQTILLQMTENWIHELSWATLNLSLVLFKDFWCNIHIFINKGILGDQTRSSRPWFRQKSTHNNSFAGYLNRNLFFGLGGKMGSTYIIWFGHFSEKKNPTQTITLPIPFPFLTLSEWDFLLSFCHLLTPLAHHSIFSSLLTQALYKEMKGSVVMFNLCSSTKKSVWIRGFASPVLHKINSKDRAWTSTKMWRKWRIWGIISFSSHNFSSTVSHTHTIIASLFFVYPHDTEGRRSIDVCRKSFIIRSTSWRDK